MWKSRNLRTYLHGGGDGYCVLNFLFYTFLGIGCLASSPPSFFHFTFYLPSVTQSYIIDMQLLLLSCTVENPSETQVIISIG
jgi:hypothetical protein